MPSKIKGQSKLSKQKWEKLLKKPSTRKELNNIWKSKNPNKKFKSIIKKISKKK